MTNLLQSENLALRQQLATLLQEARRNEEKMHRFDQLERQLIGASSLQALVRLLLTEYKLAFAVEHVTLTLIDTDYEATRILDKGVAGDSALPGLTLLKSADPLLALYGDARCPILGPYDVSQHQSLFGMAAGSVASVALLPLSRQGQIIGGLHLGSASLDRYVAGCRTDFLERLADVIAICLESALARERLKQMGLTDALTGVQNRRYFEHRCLVEISQARRYKHPLACMFLDVDKFKRINDTHGHQTGDDILRSVATIIQSQLRSGDTIARYGGEEFVVLLPQSEWHHARQIAERIRARIEEGHFQAHSGHAIKATISIGVSMLPTKDLSGENQVLAERLVADADKALYHAKHTGRNRVVCDVPLEKGSLKASLLKVAFPAMAQRLWRLTRGVSARMATILKRLVRA